MQTISTVLFAVAGVGLLILSVEFSLLALHTSGRDPSPSARPAISVLKPLCGSDDDLATNLASFAELDWPDYEVLLGIPDASDPALPIARTAAARWPNRFRVVFQRGEPGANPKVNQLVTLARAARHDILVVSDSNVRVPLDYLAGIAGHLEDPEVALVTHLVTGEGEESVGSLFDALHLTGYVAAAVATSKRLAGKDVVVGKSMALRRCDLVALGGFLAVKDVLAEDFVLGRWISTRLGRRVALAHRPITNISRSRSVKEFLGRYRRWAVLQRQMVSTPFHAAAIVLNPVVVSAAAAAAALTWRAVIVFASTCAVRALLDAASGNRLRPGGFAPRQLALVPLKDFAFAAAWWHGLVSEHVIWRGKKIRVLRGTHIAVPSAAEGQQEHARVAGAA